MRIETVELDDRNIAHVTTRVSATEIREVFDNSPVFHRNKSGRTADYVAIGVTDGGSRVRVNFAMTPRAALPVRSVHGGWHDPKQGSRRDERRGVDRTPLATP